MTSIKQNLLKKFRNKEYRESFSGSHASSEIATQISLMRGARGWSQEELAEKADMKQSRISVMEDPSYESFNIKTLKRIAVAYDVGLLVRFVSFGELLNWVVDLRESQLCPPSFDEDPAFKPYERESTVGSALSAVEKGIEQRQHSSAIEAAE